MQATQLSERLSDWNTALSVDSKSRIVGNVALTGSDSRNGYRYSESALRDALPLYDHKPVFLDHANDRSRPRDRSTRDLVGSITNPRFESGRIRGDIHVLDTESGRTFLTLAASNAPGVGMSHVVLARRSHDGATVESIDDVVSVDAVINPATTTTFQESTNSTPSVESTSPGNDQTKAESSSDSRDHQLEVALLEVAELTDEIARLRGELDAASRDHEQEVQVQRMDAILSESQLPDFAVTPLFRRQLAEAADESSRHELIQERHSLIRQSARHPPSSSSRSSAGPDTASTAAFLSAIKRR